MRHVDAARAANGLTLLNPIFNTLVKNPKWDFSISNGKHHPIRNSTKILDREKVLGRISYKKSTPVGLPHHRSKIKIDQHVGMKEVLCERPPTLFRTEYRPRR